MLIPFGVLSAAGAGLGFESDYELIASEILGSDTASVIFSNLGDYSSTYKHLQVRAVARSNGAFADDTLRLRFNADTGSNYSFHQLFGNGSSVVSGRFINQTGAYPAQIAAAASASNIFSGAVIDILDPYSTSKNTTIRGLSGITGNANLILLRSGAWLNTASITSITLAGIDGGNLLAGSRFSLYGIKG
jgi:hypothetical protein